MKPKVIKWGKNGEKSVVINKDFFNMLLGILLVVSCALLSGVLQLVEARFDFSAVSTSEFWINYILKLSTGYMCLFGTYILRKVKNQQSAKFVIQRENLKAFKREIVEKRQIATMRAWLKNIYNYRKRVERYQDIILSKYEHVVLEKPEKPLKEDFQPFNKRKYNRAIKRYQKALKKYEKAEKQKEYLEKQLKVCDTHFAIIEAYKTNNLDNVRELSDEIKDIDDMKAYKINIKNVTYNSLFNFDILKGMQEDSIFYNEKSLLAKKLIPTMLIGVFFVTLISSMIPDFKQATLETIFMIVLNLMIMGWYMFSGITLANNYIFKVVYTADQNRISICEQFKEDIEPMKEMKEEPFLEEENKPSEN